VSESLSGSCLCGAVRYRIHGPLGRMGHCHCSMCRKIHGSAFGTYASVARRDFEILAGAEKIRRYASSPAITRTFCERCGAILQHLSERDDTHFELAVGTLDDDPGVRPSHHIWVGSKAPWYEISDDLPQHPMEPQETQEQE